MLSWFGLKSEDKSSSETKSSNQDKKSSSTVEEAQPGDDEVKAEDAMSTGNADGPKSSSTEEAASGVSGAMGFLRNMASAAGKKAYKLKESVDEKLEQTIIGEFERENERFVKEKHSKRTEDPAPPWVGYHEEEEMKTQILSLSSDERNFLRNPPSGVEFYFELDASMPIALTILEEDKKLQDMRFKLVPKKVKEETFWRNYFYRVSLIKQSSQLSTLAHNQTESKRSNSSLNQESARSPRSEPNKDSAEKSKDESSPNSSQSEKQPASSKEGSPDGAAASSSGQEQADSGDWEKELQEELQEFEFVSEDQGDNQETNPEWEKEIEDMLGLEDEDDTIK